MRAQRSFCGDLMWSLTSQRERRTSGPENFQSSTKKDFFNFAQQSYSCVKRQLTFY